MKGYLVLNNGCVLNGVVSDNKSNIVGDIIFGIDNSISIVGNDLTSKISVSESEFTNLESKFKESSLIGKIVIDTLPIEYHMYDVQSAF
ncbi:MAG: hypothetical protein WBA54_01395 [Acidaminobacteraceae bacterium]